MRLTPDRLWNFITDGRPLRAAAPPAGAFGMNPSGRPILLSRCHKFCRTVAKYLAVEATTFSALIDGCDALASPYFDNGSQPQTDISALHSTHSAQAGAGASAFGSGVTYAHAKSSRCWLRPPE